MILHQLFTDIDDFCNHFLTIQNSQNIRRQDLLPFLT